MRQLPVLIAKEALLLLRDPQGLLLLFVMPVVFIVVMSLAMQDAYELGGERTERVMVHDADDTYASQRLIGGIREQLDGVQVLVADESITAEDLQAGIRAGHYRLALRVPEGFEDALLERSSSDGAREVAVYHAPELPAPVRELFTSGLEGALTQSVLIAELEGVTAMWGGAEADRLLEQMPVVATVTPVQEGGRAQPVPNAVQQSVPAWLVFAMFFVVVPLAASFVVEREQGATWRLRQLNVHSALILGSRFPAYYAVNLVQLVLMLAVGVFLVPALGGEQLELGAQPLGLWLVATGTSVAAIGFAMLVACLTRTVIQATLLGGVAVLIMAALGGIMVPKAVMPAAMQELAQLSPMSWALEGFWDMVLRHRVWHAVMPEVLMLAAFGAFCWFAASVLYNRASR